MYYSGGQYTHFSRQQQTNFIGGRLGPTSRFEYWLLHSIHMTNKDPNSRLDLLNLVQLYYNEQQCHSIASHRSRAILRTSGFHSSQAGSSISQPSQAGTGSSDLAVIFVRSYDGVLENSQELVANLSTYGLERADDTPLFSLELVNHFSQNSSSVLGVLHCFIGMWILSRWLTWIDVKASQLGVLLCVSFFIWPI